VSRATNWRSQSILCAGSEMSTNRFSNSRKRRDAGDSISRMSLGHARNIIRADHFIILTYQIDEIDDGIFFFSI